jgi:hypothetical protein
MASVLVAALLVSGADLGNAIGGRRRAATSR